MTDKVLFSRSKDSKNNMEEDCDHDNPWDDTLLIEAYDRAISLAKANLAKNMANPKESKNSHINNNTNINDSFKESTEIKRSGNSSAHTEGWKVGSHCRSVWSQDGVEYEADIVSLKTNRNQARVRFVGYNNEENTKLNMLKPSYGEEARQLQISESRCDMEENGFPRSNLDASYVTSPPDIEEGMMFPPPPPPHVISYLPKGEQEALSAMLMSWYMSGYHTGYYQGLINAKNNSVNKRK